MPDLGSFVNDNGTYKRTLFGLGADMSKLEAACEDNPNLFTTGEVALCVDTHETYIYERTTAKWYLQ